MAMLGLLIALAGIQAAVTQNSGYFWHISDHHLDPYYNINADNPEEVCPSSYGVALDNPGPWGNYRCDSPWKLINSSAYAMKGFKGDPDFIIWTGDDTLHTGEQDKYLGEKKVVEIIGNITMLLKEVFPNTKFYAAPGNHDYHPKSQIPPGNSAILSAMADLWKDWMTPEAHESFNNSGYYTETFGTNGKHRLISLNSNLWYTSNKVVEGEPDPGNQFQWLEETLKIARDNSQKVFLIGHVPPGYFELVDYKYWYYEDYSKKFNSIIRSYAGTIAGQFFGHHHSDTFRIFKDETGKTVSSMLLTPGVTPWMTTLPGAVDGANNPGIRLYEYDIDTLDLIDFTQYYLNLTAANVDSSGKSADWEIEYKATEAYSIPDVSTASLASLAEQMRNGCEEKNCSDVFTRYALYNSVSYNTKECKEICQRDQLCAITEVEYEAHRSCIENWGSFGHRFHPNVILILSLLVAIAFSRVLG